MRSVKPVGPAEAVAARGPVCYYKKAQTQDDAVKTVLKGKLPSEPENEDDECDDVYEDYVV